MKKLLLVPCALMFLLLLICGASAQEEKTTKTTECKSSAPVDTKDMRYNKSPFNKLGRGAINAVTCWLEIPAEVCRVSEEKGPIAGYTLGMVEGVFTTFLRAASALFDAATFIIPPYNKPLMQPEYAIDSFTDSFRELGEAEDRPDMF